MPGFRERHQHRAAARAGLTNTLIYALDVEAHTHFTDRGLPSSDGSAQMAAWERTRLQRHIQRAEAERHVAAAALAAGVMLGAALARRGSSG